MCQSAKPAISHQCGCIVPIVTNLCTSVLTYSFWVFFLWFGITSKKMNDNRDTELLAMVAFLVLMKLQKHLKNFLIRC